MTDFYAKVPKDIDGNLKYRIKIAKQCQEVPEFRAAMIEACRHDILFWLNAFCWLYEPRTRIIEGKRQPTEIPFISWIHQDPVILTLLESPNWVDKATGTVGRDIIIEKSRGEGFSWMALMVIVHQMIFRTDQVSFGIVSKSEKDADNPDNPDSLFWKIDWQLKQLPGWMVIPGQWKRSITNHTLTNLDTGSSIAAFSATENVGTGGRKTIFMMDEMHKFPAGKDEDALSSTEPVTDCRWLGSTPGPRGPAGAFYEAIKECRKGASSALLMQVHWTDNPERNRGLYMLKEKPEPGAEPEAITVDGREYEFGYPVAIYEDNPLPPGYRDSFMREVRPKLLDRGFNLEEKSKERSPWYDGRCLRSRMTPRRVAQEYDMNYGGSASRFFPVAVLEKLQNLCTEPFIRGELHFGEDMRPRWHASQDGRLHLWMNLIGALNRPPEKKYVVAADIATGGVGLMSSNSTFSVGELNSGIKVASFAFSGIKPTQFAQYGVALSKWFHNATLIWEGNGPGDTFKDEVLRLGYDNIYYRIRMDEVHKLQTNRPGWWSSTKTKRTALEHLSYCYTEGYFHNPDRQALEEAMEYQEYPGGRIAHVSSENSDPSGAGEQHGDRVIADMLLCHLICETVGKKPEEIEKSQIMKDPPATSFRYRQLKAQEEKKKPGRQPWTGRKWKKRRRF